MFDGNGFSDFLYHRRISRRRFAEAMGVRVTTVQRWCDGLGVPTDENLAKMGELLGVNPEQFMIDTDPTDAEWQAVVDKLGKEKAVDAVLAAIPKKLFRLYIRKARKAAGLDDAL